MLYDKSKQIKNLARKGIYSYEGQVNSKGQRDGIGRNMNTQHKLMFEGEYDEGLRHGYGRAIFKGGNIYEGEWEEWNMQGKGKVTILSG